MAKKIVTRLSNHTNTFVTINGDNDTCSVTQVIRLCPLIDLDISGRPFYYGIRKFIIQSRVVNLGNNSVSIIDHSYETNSRKGTSGPKILTMADNHSVSCQVLISEPESVEIEFSIELSSSSGFLIRSESYFAKPMIFTNDFSNQNFGRALFKIATAKKSEYNNSLGNIERELRSKYAIIIQEANDNLRING